MPLPEILILRLVEKVIEVQSAIRMNEMFVVTVVTM